METNGKISKRLTYLDIAKGIGIILVVIGHCIPDASTPAGVSRPLFKILFQVIYSFHMPLFFFISGYLASLNGLQIKDKALAIKKKAKRLLIPYFFVGLCYMPLKILLGSFANKPYDIHNLWKLCIGVNPDGELWFLYALFVISTIAIIYGRKITKIELFATGILTLTCPILPSVTTNLFYFFLGSYMSLEVPNFFQKIKFREALLDLAVFVIANCLAICYGYNSAFCLVTATSGIGFCLYVSNCLSQCGCRTVNLLEKLGIFSMDIYILSDIIKIPFRMILWNRLHLYRAAFFVCTFAAIALSYIIGKYIIRKNRWLKLLIFGE